MFIFKYIQDDFFLNQGHIFDNAGNDLSLFFKRVKAETFDRPLFGLLCRLRQFRIFPDTDECTGKAMGFAHIECRCKFLYSV